MKGFINLINISFYDLLQRIHSKGFLTVIAFVIIISTIMIPPNSDSAVGMTLGSYRGLYNSVWVGALLSAEYTLFISFVGFHIMKERSSGVQELIGATQISKTKYIFSKAISKFLMLLIIMIILIGNGIILQLLKGEDANINILHILAPFMAVALPSTILISGISVLFDVIPILSGGFGSFLYFLIIVFIGGLSLSGSVDILGIGIMLSPMTEQLKKFDSNYSGTFTIFGNDAYSKVFCFQELDWSLGSLLSRILLIAASICIIIIAAKLFKFTHEDSVEEIEENLQDSDKLKNNMTRVHKENFVLSRIPGESRRYRLKDLLYAELGLVVRNTNAFILFMYAAVIGLYLLLPLDSVKGLIISLLWILPLSILSQINTRNVYDSTREMIQSTAYFNRMETLTHYLCGILIVFLPNVPLICKGLLLGQHIDITMIIAGSIFIPALALFLGAWSKSPNLFQGLYLFVWYIGIGGNVYILNFTGLCNAGPGIGMKIFVVYLALSFVLLAGTYIKRLIELKTK